MTRTTCSFDIIYVYAIPVAIASRSRRSFHVPWAYLTNKERVFISTERTPKKLPLKICRDLSGTGGPWGGLLNSALKDHRWVRKPLKTSKSSHEHQGPYVCCIVYSVACVAAASIFDTVLAPSSNLHLSIAPVLFLFSPFTFVYICKEL